MSAPQEGGPADEVPPLDAQQQTTVRTFLQTFLITLLSMPVASPKPGKKAKDMDASLLLRALAPGLRSELCLGVPHVRWILGALSEGPELRQQIKHLENERDTAVSLHRRFEEVARANETIIQGYQTRQDQNEKRIAALKDENALALAKRNTQDVKLAAVLDRVAEVVSGQGKPKPGVPDLRKAQFALEAVAGVLRFESSPDKLSDVYHLRPFLPDEPSDSDGPDHTGDHSSLSQEDT